MSRLFVLLLIIAATGCSNKAIYDAVQTSSRHSCDHHYGDKYEDCIERHKTTYEDYKRQREEILFSK